MNYKDTNAKAWNNQSSRYLSEADFSSEVLDFGDPRCLTDDDLHLVGEVSGKKILELGCGGGHIGRGLAKRGGQVTEVDISEQQIQAARSLAVQAGVSIAFEVSSIEDYRFREAYDLIISICAFHYVDHLEKVIGNISKHLVSGGILVFSTNHPAFYTAAYTTIWRDEKENTHYFDERPETWKWKEHDKYVFTTFPHPIEFYINSLAASNMVIEKMHELTVPHREIADEEERLETIFPRYLVIKAVKSR